MTFDKHTERGFGYTEFEFSDYRSTEKRTFQIQESSLVEPRLWVGPNTVYVDLGGEEKTLMERAHLDVDSVRKLRDALSLWLEEFE